MPSLFACRLLNQLPSRHAAAHYAERRLRRSLLASPFDDDNMPALIRRDDHYRLLSAGYIRRHAVIMPCLLRCAAAPF